MRAEDVLLGLAELEPELVVRRVSIRSCPPANSSSRAGRILSRASSSRPTSSSEVDRCVSRRRSIEPGRPPGRGERTAGQASKSRGAAWPDSSRRSFIVLP